jgi:hypothetical protein
LSSAGNGRGIVVRKELSGEIRVTGVINEDEFAAAGEAHGNPETGEYEVTLEYETVPRDWDPLMYSDVKVSLLFHREEDGGQNFLSLADGRYRSAGTIDLGDGNVLRNNTVIEVLEPTVFRAVYVMYGTARTGRLTGIEHFEETMLPFGPGRVAAIAVARWRKEDGEPLDALFSTRYEFENGAALKRPQMRRMDAEPTFETKGDNARGRLRHGTFRSRYNGVTRRLPPVVDEGGPYMVT